MNRFWCFLTVLAWTQPVPGVADGPVAYRIETVAGSASIGDGGPSTMAQIGAIQGIALDRSGNLYLSDTDHHRVRKVSPNGVITTVAGTGSAGFSGDGGPAATSQLNLPYGVAVDLTGSVYIADLGNNRVRRIDLNGVISTVAGTGASGSSGDGGPAAAAQLATPRNVVVDSSGNLYISEFAGHRIRKVSTDGKIATAAGTGVAGFQGDGASATSAQLNSPAGLAVDGTGSLYVADSQNNRVRKIVPGGIISTVVGGSGGLATPHAVAVDALGTIYVADSTASVVYAYTAAGQSIQFAGGAVQGFQGDGGPAAAAELTNVLDLAIDPTNNIFLADGVRVRKVDLQGNIQTVAGDGYTHAVGDGGSATAAVLRQPSAVALDRSGNLFIADTGTQRVRQVLSSGTIVTLAGVGIPVWGLAPEEVPAASAGLNYPMGVATDPLGNIFIADTDNHNIRKVGADRLIVTAVGTSQGGIGPASLPPTQTQLRGPQGVCFDRLGTLFVVDSSNHRVLRVTSPTLTDTVAGNGYPGNAGDGGPAQAAQLNQPAACALDSFGNLFLADTLNHRIRKVTSAGVITTVAGTGDAGYTGDEGPAANAQIQSPRGVAVDDSGNLYLADTGNHCIRQVTPDGVIHTIAGQGTAGFLGDGGPAAAALLNAPGGLFLDGSGAIYLADTGNDRVRRLDPASATVSAPVSAPVTNPAALSAANAASLLPGAVAPGEIVALSGTGLGPGAGVAASFDSGMLPTQLGGSEVRFDGADAPLFYVQSGQINVQAPYALSGKTTTHVEVWYQGQSAGSVDLAVAATAPALYPVALNADGSANSATRPAAAGDVLTLYATGEGLTNGSNISGKTAQAPYPRPQLPVSLKIANVAAQLVDAFSAPGVVGVLQVTARVPAGLAAGQAALQLSVGGVAAPGLAIWLK
jgi:uncharacterized protein (TIGR03437 family)